jgi:aminoglycoside phosphotransferase family enzyme
MALARKVAFLQQPEAYVARPQRVESIETHMAWVFLTEDRAYKLKKPIRDSFRDFSTLAARRQICHDEVRLNSRLAAGVYLGVVPLVVDVAGQLALRGQGSVVDWLVEMRRLPASLMLDHKLSTGDVSELEAHRTGDKLARFYQDARRIDMSASDYRRRLGEDIGGTRRVLDSPGYGLPAALIDQVAERLLQTLDEHAALFAARAHQRRIVDGHGDLRPEHVCLEPEPMIIDCIEFNQDLRVLDALSDLGFLALECQRLGAEAVGRMILDAYIRATGDRVDERVLRFYLAQHAYSRAKVAIWHLDDPHQIDAGRGPARWIAKALRYLDLAREHACA